MIRLLRVITMMFGLIAAVITLMIALIPGDATPPSAWILFVSQRNNDIEIYRMRADGSQQQRLTTSSPTNTSPKSSPDGQWIVFVSTRDGNQEIYQMRADGTEQQRLSTTPGYEGLYRWSPSLHRSWHPWRLLGICGSLVAVVLVSWYKKLR
jgi:dipeptidyl aminopeptidase/acylaminoacyl peptidase